jgi:hypothetical protein
MQQRAKMRHHRKDTAIGGADRDSNTPWTDEFYHDDGNFDLLRGEKRVAGRERLNRSNAAALTSATATGAKAVARALRSCGPGHRCGSGACVHCSTAARRHLIRTIEVRFGKEPTALLTIIPSDPALQPMRLSRLDVREHRADLSQKLNATGFNDVTVIGGLDISWDTYEGTVFARFWSLHWHLIIPRTVAKEAQERLSFLYPPSQTIHSPVHAKPITKTPHKAYSYCLKSVFDARHQRIVDPTHRQLSTRYTITANHTKFAALAHGLHQIGIVPRVFDTFGDRKKGQESGN